MMSGDGFVSKSAVDTHLHVRLAHFQNLFMLLNFSPLIRSLRTHTHTHLIVRLAVICPPFCLQAQLIAQSIGQAFSVAYQEFLRANGINPEDLSQKEYSDIINTQEMYNDDLIHFSNSDNCKEVFREKDDDGGFQDVDVVIVICLVYGWKYFTLHYSCVYIYSICI